MEQQISAYIYGGNTNVLDVLVLGILFQLTCHQQRETKSKAFTKFSTANCRVHETSLAFWTRLIDRDSC